VPATGENLSGFETVVELAASNVAVNFGAPGVEIPAARNEPVVIVEDYGYRGQEGETFKLPSNIDHEALLRGAFGHSTRERAHCTARAASRCCLAPGDELRSE
jgi:hypothetical protein